jgi:putative endonuclease
MNLMRRSTSKAIKSTIGTTNDRPTGSFVHILVSSDKTPYRTYVGWTIDLDRRLAQHNAGTGAHSTRGRSWTLIYVEGHCSAYGAENRWIVSRREMSRR